MSHQSRQRKPFAEHLFELRDRSLIVFVSIGIGSVIGYQLYGLLLKLLLAPLHQSIYYTSPLGGFNFTLQLSLLFGIFVSFPILLYQLFQFVVPALPESIEKKLVPFMFASLLLMILGVLFSYFIGLPTALHFLASFSSGGIHSLISANDYFTFATRYLFGFGLLFQLPVLLIVINYIKPLKPKMLFRYQRHVIAVSFIIGLFLSPAADPLDMTLMALPLILLYYFSIFFIFLINRNRKRNVLLTDTELTQELTKPVSIVSSICYFIVIVLVSGLFGLAFLFSYATYKEIQQNHIPLQKILVLPRQYNQFRDSVVRGYTLLLFDIRSKI